MSKDILFGEVSGEIKQYLKATVLGDVFVDVRVQFRPSIEPYSSEDKMALDMVNARLRMLSGEISHSVREFLNEQLTSKDEL